MSCSACEDGWVYVGDAARACECRRRQVSSFRGDYAPGGLTLRAHRRARARKAGLASGVARRQRSRGRAARPRSRQEALALAYSIRQVGAAEFERRYKAMCAAEGLPFDRRGLNSTHALYRAQVTAYRAQGQDYETTNAQAARALELRGRRRCRRTVQRLRRRLVAMELIVYHHIKRSGKLRIRGQMDTLRVRLLVPGRANVTPPSGAGAGLVPRPAPAPFKEKKEQEQAETALSPPPSSADEEGAASPPATERERIEARIRFVQLKLDVGFGNRVGLELELHRLRMELRHGEPPQASPPSAPVRSSLRGSGG